MPTRLVDADFILPVEGVFSIEGRGTVVTGLVERGNHLLACDSVVITNIYPRSSSRVYTILIMRILSSRFCFCDVAQAPLSPVMKSRSSV